MGYSVLTAGRCRIPIGVIPPVRWFRPYLIERAGGVLALFLRRDPGRGREGFEDHDGDRAQSDSA
jgi:hypothetical protein